MVSYGAKARFGSDLRTKWFKGSANSKGLLDKLKAMDTYINVTCAENYGFFYKELAKELGLLK